MRSPSITVTHVKAAPLDAVYIGRKYRGRPASPLANPFKVRIEADRKEAIERYRGWLGNELSTWPGSAAAQEIKRLAAMHRAGQPIVLACWCAPRPCHGDVVAEFVRKAVTP